MNFVTEGDPLEQLETKMNRWRQAPPGVGRSTLSPRRAEGSADWGAAGEVAASQSFPPMLKKFLLVAVVFFFAMLGVAVFVFYRGENLVRTGNINLEIAGPKTAKAGEEVTLQLSLTNQNNTPLEFVDVTVEYPPGTRSAADPGVELPREKLSWGTIKPAETRKQSVKALLFGEERSQREIRVITEYRLADSNAIFDKTSTYVVEITEAPLVLALSAPEAVDVGQDFAVEIAVSAEPGAAGAEPAVSVHYPSGFEFKSATPAPTIGNTIWLLDNFKPGQETKIRIIGQLIAQDNDEKVIRAEVGTDFRETTSQLGVLYDSDLKTVMVRRPEVELVANINGEKGAEYVAANRDPLKARVEWENNLTDDLTDVEIRAVLDGSVLDPLSITPIKGFYQSSSRSIVWNKASDADLATIEAGSRGSISFSFAGTSLLAASNQTIRNPEIGFVVTLTGRRPPTSAAGRSEIVKVETTGRIKYTSVSQLAAKAVYHSGTLPGSGPLPPKVGQKTTYTIVWSLLNSSNDLADGRVQAIMPPSVEWVGQVTPAGEPLEFVAAPGGGGEIIWTPGAIKAGVGTRLPSREVSFQVALTPSRSQVGEVPRLLSAPQFSAVDTFTQEKISSTLRQDLTTYLVSDSNFALGDEKVVE